MPTVSRVRSWEVKMRKDPFRGLPEHGSLVWVQLGSVRGRSQKIEQKPDTRSLQESRKMFFTSLT